MPQMIMHSSARVPTGVERISKLTIQTEIARTRAKNRLPDFLNVLSRKFPFTVMFEIVLRSSLCTISV